MTGRLYHDAGLRFGLELAPNVARVLLRHAEGLQPIHGAFGGFGLNDLMSQTRENRRGLHLQALPAPVRGVAALEGAELNTVGPGRAVRRRGRSDGGRGGRRVSG